MQHNGSRDGLMRLGLLLQLQRRARQAEAKELPFIVVNETRLLVTYRQAVFWQAGADGNWKVASVSGLAAPDSGSPFVLWLDAVARALHKLPPYADVAPLDQHALPGQLGTSWGEWLPSVGLWLPVYAGGKVAGALALFRDAPFGTDETELLRHLVESYGQCIAPPARPQGHVARLSALLKRRRNWVVAVLCLALLFPVRQSVLAPAELIASQPAHIRAALDGVVKSIHVQPNQKVVAGDKLLSLEEDQLRMRLVVAQKNLDIARAELQQTQQLSLVDPRAKIRLPMLQGRVDQLVAEMDLVSSQLARIHILSPVDGLAVFDSPDAWLGRPVALGQKIMEVADPAKVQLEISLPISETLPLKLGDAVLFFPNIKPHAPLSGTLTFIGYQASETPGAGLAFSLRADFVGEESVPRLGLRGTAKLYGDRMPLAALLLRRPFLQLRQWLGL